MLRVRHFILALSCVLFPVGCNAVGCAGEDPDQDKTAEEQLIGATEQALPAPDPGKTMLYGTWAGDSTAGHFTALVLMSDQRYHATKAIVCVKHPCDPALMEGKYSLYAKDGRTYFVLGEKTAPGAEHFEYAITADSMRIRPLVPGSEWYSMARAPAAWCATSRECNVQNLPPGVCAGAYACEQSTCTWKCARPTDTSAGDPAKPTGATTP